MLSIQKRLRLVSTSSRRYVAQQPAVSRSVWFQLKFVPGAVLRSQTSVFSIVPFFFGLLVSTTKVVLPLALGQLARYTPVRTLHERLPKAISRLSECILLTVIYTTFCDTFLNAACELSRYSRQHEETSALAVSCQVFALGHALYSSSWMTTPWTFSSIGFKLAVYWYRLPFRVWS